MNYHLERGLRLNVDPEHKPLYNWAINEIDAQGKKVGNDQIPWVWTLYFSATSAVLGDSIEIRNQYQSDETAPPKVEVEQRQVIRVQLRPGDLRDEDDFRRNTTYRMFGTDRAIKSFQLDIHPIADAAGQESCRAWGCPSYTSENDFVDETTDDCIVFYLYVKPETFARYAAKVSLGTANEIIFSVGSVTGFYSGWSPSISTSSVKVLTADREHKVELPPGVQVEPPRLGDVGEARLYINRRLEFGKGTPDPRPAEEPARVTTVQATTEVPAPPMVAADPQMLQMFKSLRRSARFAVVLLALIFITTLLKS